MSTQREITLALKALATAALRGAGYATGSADIRGFEQTASEPFRASAAGSVTGYPDDAEEIGVSLGPLVHHLRQPFVLRLLAPDIAPDQAASLDAMAGRIGAAIVADRELGGLADWIEAAAMQVIEETPFDSDQMQVGEPVQVGEVTVIVEYSSSDPLN
ncbi:hypothetical protein [Stakelama tenebrarum]|uniref:Uncharacterized protein n=1 Tax=Stakelama tenebrarum TaxID=2711215 RepID=A0A6G6Y5J0_9SPHN|nr:hypothetical protein [Sphingosinithalassobacter tenebrarum]QIG79988.1 hypothetical protein G5C33_09505 [Sphingosinithalassobacter tenebrarum]